MMGTRYRSDQDAAYNAYIAQTQSTGNAWGQSLAAASMTAIDHASIAAAQQTYNEMLRRQQEESERWTGLIGRPVEVPPPDDPPWGGIFNMHIALVDKKNNLILKNGTIDLLKEVNDKDGWTVYTVNEYREKIIDMCPVSNSASAKFRNTLVGFIDEMIKRKAKETYYIVMSKEPINIRESRPHAAPEN